MKKSQGFAFVMVLLIVGVVAVLVAGSMLLSVVNRNISKNDVLSAQAVNVAQAGNSFWKAELVSLYQYMMENFDEYEEEVNNYLAENPNDEISCGNYFAIGIDLDRNGEIGDAGDITSDQINSANGAYLPERTISVAGSEGIAKVQVRVNGSAIELDARGEFATAKGRVQEAFSINSVNVWNNAVFADSGAAQATINGRAEIRGAVHLLGEGLSASDPALKVSGTFGLGNTYKSLSSSLSVNTLRLSTPDPKDLCATLRVRSGHVVMESESSRIGYNDDDPTDDLVHNMRGIYTDDGFKGHAVEDATIFSENGMSARYDAGNSFKFPDLNEQVEYNDVTKARHSHLKDNGLVFDFDPVTAVLGSRDIRNNFGAPQILKGGRYLTPDCFQIGQKLASATTGPSYAELWTRLEPLALTALSLRAGPLTASLLPVISGLAQRGQGPKPDYDTRSGYTLEYGKTESFSCSLMKRNADGNEAVVSSIKWDKLTNTLEIGGTGGVVTFVGRDLVIEGSGASGAEIKYKGEGILFAESSSWDSDGIAAPGTGGNIIMGVDFLPALTETFPATTVMGLVARNYVLSNGAQKRFTVAMYGQEGVAVEKQTLVAGGIVTRTFNAGSNVPTVLYVSNLAERVPDLMPGVGTGGFSISNVAWSRR